MSFSEGVVTNFLDRFVSVAYGMIIRFNVLKLDFDISNKGGSFFFISRNDCILMFAGDPHFQGN